MAKDTGTAPAPRPAEQSAQRGPRRPRGRGEDHPGRGPARRHRRAAARRPGRGRHHLPRHRGGRGPPAALGVARASRPSSTPATGITLLDTPGSPDFVGELRAGLRAADAALFVVSAVNGVDATTVQLWEECAAVGMPRAVVITQLDRARADVDDAVRLCQTHARGGRLPGAPGRPRPGRRRARPGLAARAPTSHGRAGGRPAPRRADRGDHRRERGRGAHGALPRRRRAGPGRPDRRPGDRRRPRALPPGAVRRPADRGRHRRAARAARRRRSRARWSTAARRSPGPTASPGAGAGLRPRRAAGRRGRQDDDRPLPGPGLAGARLLRHAAARHRRSTSPATAWPTAAIPTTTSTSGSARSPRRWARTLRPVAACPAGDICAVARLGQRRDRRHAVLAGGPAPGAAVGPAHAAAAGRASRPRPAPTRTGWPRRWPGWSPRTRPSGSSAVPTPASCCCGAWARRTPRCCSSGCAPGTASRSPPCPVRVPMVETLAGPARVTGRHVKQSGGHGQYAVVVVEGEPGPPGSGVVFEQRIVGGTVPSQFHGSVEKGIRTQAERGDQRRPAARRRPRHPGRRQVALGRLLRRRLPGGRRAGPARARRRRRHARARAVVRGARCVVPGGVRRRGDERPVRPPGAGHRQRGRPGPRPDDGARRGARGRAAHLSRACCARSPTAPAASPAVRSATSRHPRQPRGARLTAAPPARPGPLATCGGGSPRAVPVRRLPARTRGPLASGTVCSGAGGSAVTSSNGPSAAAVRSPAPVPGGSRRCVDREDAARPGLDPAERPLGAAAARRPAVPLAAARARRPTAGRVARPHGLGLHRLGSTASSPGGWTRAAGSAHCSTRRPTGSTSSARWSRWPCATSSRCGWSPCWWAARSCSASRCSSCAATATRRCRCTTSARRRRCCCCTPSRGCCSPTASGWLADARRAVRLGAHHLGHRPLRAGRASSTSSRWPASCAPSGPSAGTAP